MVAPASASPWAEVGDAQLRSDIEILAAANVIDDITTHWPLPWASIVSRLREHDLADEPDYVRAAAQRVLSVAQAQMRFDELQVGASLDGTNAPSVVRSFDGLGRETAQGQITAEYMTSTTAIRIAAGAELHAHTNRVAFMPDGSYVAQKLGSSVLYAGYVTHWWGPGWISALSLSNNARPMPQIGIERDETSAFRTPWLSWLGPWQAEFMVGLLDDSRVAANTIYSGMRVTFNPFPGLEIGLARTDEMCGTGHPCVPLKYYFEFANDPAHPNHTNDEGLIDLKYSKVWGGTPFEVYMQLMNEDSNPISHSVTSHLFGASIWLPMGGNPLRLTAEYTSSVPTLDIFSFGDVAHGDAYNNGGYIDGMRYRGRTLGFSLDSDSTLLSVQGAWRDADGWSYEVTYHHAAVSNPNNLLGNVVTTAPVLINMAEARVSFPWHQFHVDLAGRLQDDQPRPSHGFKAAIETSIGVNL
ncbi:MAG TPA: capsule assembly Wzi family protein [Rhizomicrobium sp.]|nr:capsule assembly Wzi family protein [Rhizomicrobium sp.]